MWISLLTLLLLLVTPISCRAEIRQEHGTRFRILLRIWGIPLRFDHSQAPMRPKPPSAQQLQKGKVLLRALPKLKRPVRLLMRQTALEQLLVHVSIALRDPAATVSTLGAAKKQMVEIARAVLQNARVIIFDEPTATLTPEEKQKVGDELFAMLKEHFAALFARRGLALSMEIVEFSEAGTWKHNNIHARFKKS